MSPIQPSPNRTEPPHFEDLDEHAFEEFCCALLEREPGVSKTDLYKVKRQTQYGVDVVGELENDGGLYVISCKVRQVLRKGDIPAFDDEFLDHWESHWKDKNVKKFILAVTYPTNSDQRQQEVDAEKTRFKKYGITYEDWPKRVLQAKVRPHRDIASQYLGEQVAEQICGREQPAIAPVSNTQTYLDASITQQLSEIQKALSGHVERQIQHAREQIRRKEGHKVDEVLQEIVGNPAQWSSLAPDTKGGVKRLMASRALHNHDIDLAIQLCDEAETFDESKTRTLRAFIALAQHGPAEALQLLDDASNSDELRLRAGLRLTLENVEGALTDLQALPEHEVDGEALRLYSLAYLMEGDREKALSFLSKAENEYGDWYAVQKTAIAVYFHLSYSPGVQFYPSIWPNPLIPELVREDDEALRYLEKGFERVEMLLEKVENDPEELKYLQVWRVAYLSNMKSRSLEAESYANELLDKDCTIAGIIVWSIARGYNLDTTRIIEALEVLIKSGKAEIEQILCLASIYDQQGNVVDVRRILDETKDRFNTPALQGSWRHWSLRNDTENIERQRGEGNADEQLAYYIHLSVKENDWTKLAGFLADAGADKLEPGHIFLACLNFARSGQWKLIEPYCDFLTQTIQTAEAIRLAAICSFNRGRLDKTIDIIDNNIHVFPGGKLPVDMRRLHHKAARGKGDFPSAITEGEKLIAETNTLEDRLEQVRTLMQIGDVSAATHHIRGMLIADDLTSTLAMQLSGTIQSTDPKLAGQLLDKVKTSELPDELVGRYLELASTLGTDSELRDVFKRLGSLAQQDSGNVRLMSLDDIREHMLESRRQAEKIDQLYRQGSFPVHFVSSHQGVTLAELILGNFLSEPGITMPQKSKLLFRFAGRQLNPDIRLENTNLHLDITSIFIAYELDLLNILEEVVAGISIAPHTQMALLRMENELKHPQPERLDHMREILAAVETNRMKVVKRTEDDTYDIVGDSQDFVVVHHDREAAKQDSDRECEIVNIRQVVNSLQKSGYVDKDKIDHIKTTLPDYMNANPLGRELNKGDKMIFDYNTLELLVGEKLLNACIQNFELSIDDRYISHARDEIKSSEYKDSIRREVAQIREFIADKIKADRYKYFTVPINQEADKQQMDFTHETEICLAELLRAKVEKATLVWSDDRYLNRYLMFNECPIVDVYDILDMLFLSGKIDKSHFYNSIAMLRKANYYYLPVTTEEIVYHLQNSGIDVSQDTETESLRIIRQYLAMIILQEDYLQFDLQHQDAFDEKKFLFGAVMLAGKCILSVWSNASIPLETKKTYSAWIWDCLRVERVKRLPVLQQTEEGYSYLYTVTLAGMVMDAMQIPADADKLETQYLEWLNEYILEPAFSADKELVGNVSKNIKNFLLEMLKDIDTKNPPSESQQAVIIYVGTFIKKLPIEVQAGILKSKSISGRLRMKSTSVVNIKEKAFIARDFWRGITKALNEGHAKIKTENKKDNIEIFRVRDNGDIPVFTIGKDGKGTLSDALFAFLSPDKSKVIKAFKDNRNWFEYPAKERKAIEKDILKIKNMVSRAKIIDKHREEAPIYKYIKLEENIRNHSSFVWDSLSPAPIQRLINHLRLREIDSDDVAIKLATAASRILEDKGPETAFRMFAGLPFYMPDEIVTAFKSMGEKEQGVAIGNIYKLCQSPLRLCHFLYLLRSIDKDVMSHELFSQAVERLQGQGINLCEAHAAVLRYFDKEFSERPEWYNLVTPERAMVVWYHSDQITNLLLSYGMPVEDIKQQFGDRHIPASNFSLLRDKSYQVCPYAPTNVRPVMLLFSGLKMAAGEGCDKSLSEVQKNAFKDLFMIGEEDKVFADPSLLQDCADYTSPLRSFLVENNYKFALSLGGEDFAELLKTETMDDLVKQTIGNISENPDDMNYWIQLFIFMNVGNVADTLPDILGVARKIDFYSLLKEPYKHAGTVLQSITRAASFSESEDVVSNHKEVLLELAKRFSLECKRPLYLTGGKSKDWVTHAAICLCDSLVLISRRNSMNETLKELADNILKCCMEWPSLAPIWRKTLNLIIDGLDFSTAALLWETLIKLRTME